VKVAVLDYGIGNLHSLTKALSRSGAEVAVERDPVVAVRADALVLPGVGAFGAAAGVLAPARDIVRRAVSRGLPCLGICLGMQLLFEASDEGGGEGLGILAGRVTKLRAERVPQIGWNDIDDATDPLVTASNLAMAYYANGFVCRPRSVDVVTAWSTHEGDRFPAVVRHKNVVGVQFHPEKSSTPGLALLQSFVDGVRT
jgi:imidazole glycerol-phosphate synthase subunit HisH